MLKRYKLIALCILTSISFVSLAQQGHSSPYSFVGIGDVNKSGLTFNRSLGGLGVGVRSSFYLNGINPAALSAIDTMSFTFEFGASGSYNILETATLKEPTMNGSIDYMAVGFPITSWWKTSVGFMPFSKVGYSLTEYVDVKDADETLFTLKRDIKGEGGINKFYMSNSLLFMKKLSVGFTFSYLFGQTKNTTTDTPTSSDAGISAYSEEITTQVSDFTYSLGLQYHDKLNEKYHYTIGAVYGRESALSTKNIVLTKSYSTGHIADTLLYDDNVQNSITLPSFLGFGFSIGTESLMFGVDYHYTMWSDVSNKEEGEDFFNSQRFIVGLEYIPKPRTATKYIHRMRYRLAANYDESYMKINNQQLKDVGITFGVGLPMKRSKSTLNLSFDIGRRGTFQDEVLSQTYFKFNIDLSLHDIWFIKRKYD